MDRGAWQATVHGIAESGMIEGLSLHFTSVSFDFWKLNLQPKLKLGDF